MIKNERVDCYLVAKESRVKIGEQFIKNFTKKGVVTKIFYADTFDEIVKHDEFVRLDGKLKTSFIKYYGEKKATYIMLEYEKKSNDKEYKFKNLTAKNIEDINEFLPASPFFQVKESGRYYLDGIDSSTIYAYYDMMAYYYRDIIKSSNVKIFLDLYPETLSRAVLSSISKELGVKYYGLYHSRFEDYLVLVGDILNQGDYLKKIYSMKCIGSEEADRAIINFKNKFELLNKDEVRVLERKYSLLRALFHMLMSLRVTLKFRNNRNNNSTFKCLNKWQFKILVADASMAVIGYNLLLIIKKYILAKRLRKNKIENKNIENHWYWPLSYTNEGEHIFTMGGGGDMKYINENIKRKNINLIVKEHRAMLAERKLSTLNWLQSSKEFTYIPATNIGYNEPIDLIKKTRGTICVNGTSGIESILLGKPTIILGNPIYAQYIRGKIKYDESLKILESLNDFSQYQEFINMKIREYVSVIIEQNLKIESYYDFLNNGDNIENIDEFIDRTYKLLDFNKE